MAETQAYLRALALTCANVERLLALTNRRLVEDLITPHFVTLLLIRLDSTNRSLLYTDAGHCPGYVLNHLGRTNRAYAPLFPGFSGVFMENTRYSYDVT